MRSLASAWLYFFMCSTGRSRDFGERLFSQLRSALRADWEGDFSEIWLPGRVRVRYGVSEVQAAFRASV
jgi:hypothetical protein